jgi:small conductance mechanosensitive channel
MNINLGAAWATAQSTITTVGLQVLGALVIYIVGRWVISFILRGLQKLLAREKFDPTLSRFLGNTLAVALNLVLVLVILGNFGVQTTSFAALLAGAGLAIGAAWSGLLANFAAGVFLIVLRPFKVGDFITGGGTTGTVKEVGLFVTTILTPDNVATFVGNNKLLSDNIQNFSSHPYRRVEITAQISSDADPHQAISAIQQRVAKIPNVLQTPAPEVAILSFTGVGPVLAVRPSCSNDNYWQVYFDTNMAIRDTLCVAPFPAPMPTYVVKQMSDAAAAAAAGAGAN